MALLFNLHRCCELEDVFARWLQLFCVISARPLSESSKLLPANVWNAMGNLPKERMVVGIKAVRYRSTSLWDRVIKQVIMLAQE